MRVNYFYILTLAGVLASCSDSIESDDNYLYGSDKTPIDVVTNLSAGPRTRAFDKTFEKTDQLFAYIEAGKLVGETFTPVADFTWANSFSFTFDEDKLDNGEDPSGAGHITSTEALSPILYWDDFSSTTYDLREANRGIRLKYGYCYNGGESNATGFNQSNGTLTWTVQTNQAVTDAMKHSDLLFATTQKMITYAHDPEDRGTLTLPYTHAMSKITINVSTGETFSADNANFDSSVLTLKNMLTKVTVDAPNDTIEASTAGDAINDVTTFISNKENTTATYQAIIAPCTNFSIGNVLASITDIDGNDYDIPITSGVMDQWKTDSHLWSAEEVIYTGHANAKPLTRTGVDNGNAYKTKPGVHYILDVTVDKQQITIRATIADWDEVKAKGIAEILFNNDVTTKGSIAEALKAKGFDVYKSADASSFTEKSTSVTFASDKWNYSPVIYWQSASDNAYFHALSPAGTIPGSITQGTDYLWGTSGSEVITPRTGDVHLDFKHAMSKLTMNLETTSNASMVTLDGAKISISNLSTTGSISVVDGSITPAEAIEESINAKVAPISNYAVIPQSLTEASIITITLADGTIYKLKLTDCHVTDSDEYVTTWEPGKHYTYTIHLEKEKITFRALVEDWVPATGNGNATLEWD